MALYQCGFRKNRNVTSLLLGLTDNIRDNFGGNKLSVLVSLDLEKAFDRVDYKLLISKLCLHYGFANSTCSLIYSYLTERSQFVSIEGRNSNVLSVKSGVPQGSVLGPILFILYVDDLFSKLDMWCNPYAFADDIQLLFKGDYQFVDVLQGKINYVLGALRNWMLENKLSVNASKSKAMIFSSRCDHDLSVVYNGMNINFVHDMACLGVLLDDKLKFDKHISNVVSNVNYALRSLYTTQLSLPFFVKKQLVSALVMPSVLYCLEVYSAANQQFIKLIQLAVNRAVRYIYSLRRRVHITPFVVKFLGCSFPAFVNQRLLLCFYKIFTSRCPLFMYASFIFCSSVRRRQMFIPKLCHTSARSFKVRVARIYNILPNNMKALNISFVMFRNRILRHFNSF